MTRNATRGVLERETRTQGMLYRPTVCFRLSSISRTRGVTLFPTQLQCLVSAFQTHAKIFASANTNPNPTLTLLLEIQFAGVRDVQINHSCVRNSRPHTRPKAHVQSRPILKCNRYLLLLFFPFIIFVRLFSLSLKCVRVNFEKETSHLLNCTTLMRW